MRAEQDIGGFDAADRVPSVATFIRDIGLDPAHGAAERHARAVGVNHTGSPALRIQAAVADVVGRRFITQTFVVVQVRTADFERTGRVVEAGHPCAVLAIMVQTTVVGRVDNAKAKLLPGKATAKVPLVEGVVLVACGSAADKARVLNVRVTAAQRNAEFLPLAFIPQRAFPGIAVAGRYIARRNAESVRIGVSCRATDLETVAAVAGRERSARLEAGPDRRQVGDFIVVARGIVGVVQLARVSGSRERCRPHQHRRLHLLLKHPHLSERH